MEQNHKSTGYFMELLKKYYPVNLILFCLKSKRDEEFGTLPLWGIRWHLHSEPSICNEDILNLQLHVTTAKTNSTGR